MKHFNMKRPKNKLSPTPAQKKSRPSEAAFDVWLERGLHELYGDAARDPIPEEWIEMIEKDREK